MHIHAQTRHTLYRQEIFTIATGKKKNSSRHCDRNAAETKQTGLVKREMRGRQNRLR